MGLPEVLCVELSVANSVFLEAEVYWILYYLYNDSEVKFQIGTYVSQREEGIWAM